MSDKEYYYPTGELMRKGVSVSGSWYGYVECYDRDGSIYENWTGYWLNDYKISYHNEAGDCYIWRKEVVV